MHGSLLERKQGDVQIDAGVWGCKWCPEGGHLEHVGVEVFAIDLHGIKVIRDCMKTASEVISWAMPLL